MTHNLQIDSDDYPDLEEVLERSKGNWLRERDVNDIFSLHNNPTISVDPVENHEEGLFMFGKWTVKDIYDWDLFDDGVVEHLKKTRENPSMHYSSSKLLLIDPVDEGEETITFERRVYRPRPLYNDCVLVHYRMRIIEEGEIYEEDSGEDTEDPGDDSTDDDNGGGDGGNLDNDDSDMDEDAGNDDPADPDAPASPSSNGHVILGMDGTIPVSQAEKDACQIFSKECLRSLKVQVPKNEKTMMMGCASRPLLKNAGKCVIFFHEYHKMFLYNAFPVESQLQHFLHDNFNAEVVAGVIENKQDAVDCFTWIFMDSNLENPRELSHLQQLLSQYNPELPTCLQGTTGHVELGDGITVAEAADSHIMARAFPHTLGQPLAHFLRETAKVSDAHIITELPSIRVGIVFSGRKAPGGRNVTWGLFEALKVHNTKSTLLGFLGCSEGLFTQKPLEITDDILRTYKNQGGRDLLGRTKDQIKTTDHVNAALKACRDLNLDGLVIIGGVTSNTDAAHLAETNWPTKVVGVPVTTNRDMKNQLVEAMGFDTICKANLQLISNVHTDALSAEKEIHGLLRQRVEHSHKQLLLRPESDDFAQLSQEEDTDKGKIFSAIYHVFGYQARGYLPSKF